MALEVIYNYNISEGPKATTSAPLGFIRGTSTVTFNSVNATIFVGNTVMHYSDPSFREGNKKEGLSSTFTTQGEANFDSSNPWEYTVTGGTSDIQNAVGYTVDRPYIFVAPTANSTAKITSIYKTHL